MAINFTPIAVGAAADAATFNAPLQELDNAIRKNNYAATTAPTVNDDSGDGYAVGSRWVDVTAGKAYVAIDVTPGAAVWALLVRSTITLSVSGLGLSGGGDLSANRTITLTSSSNPGAAAAILASDGAGRLTLALLTVTGDLTANGAVNATRTTGLTPYWAVVGGKTWQFGQNAGAGSNDDTFGFYSATLSGVVLQMAASGVITLYTPPAFVAGDKYLVVDAGGHIHVSATGPAS